MTNPRKRVLYGLISTLMTIAFLVAFANVARAATVECGRITTFVAPGSSAALVTGDGWIIIVKPDGTSTKAIIRAATIGPTGAIAGYVCFGVESAYFAGLLAPGTPGYITEPLIWVTPGTAVYCGTVAPNSIATGQGSGSRTFELQVTSGPGGGGRFAVPESLPLPAIGGYLCGRFAQGAPVNGLLAVIVAGESGYVVAGLPQTSTDASSDQLAALAAVAVGMLLVATAIRRSGIGGTRQPSVSSRS